VTPSGIEPPEELRIRREASRRATRRHRLQAAGLISLVIVTVGAILLGDLWGVQAGEVQSQTAASHPGAHPTNSPPRSTSSSPATTGASATGAATGSASAVTGGQAKPGKTAVPILMYHVIAAPPPGAPFPGLYVEPSEFAAQMQALKNAGWHAVTLDRVQAYWLHGVSLGSGKPIVVSFDNGYQSQYTQALPVLRRLGWVGDENIQLTGLPPSQGGLSQAQVRGLVTAGWELDTQGISHADLIALDATQLHDQVAVARRIVQQRYHVPVNWFCYPSGHYDSTVIAAVKSAGFVGSTTVVPGWAHPSEDRFRLHRLRVLGGTSPSALLAQIADIRDDPPAPTSYNGT
jgi:peptidoglycan/xylan/chitin deacetylase (PgdA/CDA1 family)